MYISFNDQFRKQIDKLSPRTGYVQVVKFRSIYIAQHTYVFYSPQELHVVAPEATLHNMCVFYSPPYTTLYHLRQHCKTSACCTTWGNERTFGANLNWQRPILLLKNCSFFFFTAVVFPQNQNQGLLLCSSFPQNQNLELPSSRLASSRQSWGWQFLVTPLQTANKNALTLSVGNYWRIIYGQQK